MDFTSKTYARLIEAIQEKNYILQTFKNFIENPIERSVVLRHDIDRMPQNALKVAELEKRLGVKSSYYFRSVKESFDEEIITKISDMGHEIGYHYENLAVIGKSSEVRSKKSEDRKQKKGSGIWDLGFGKKKNGRSPAAGSLPPDYNRELYNLALENFERNLDRFRKIVDIKTICMHGSPTSKYDSRDLWKVYDYHDYGIIGEPYFDIDFSKVLYLTDTGRRWDGERYNIRDKVNQKSEVRSQKSENNSPPLGGLGASQEYEKNQGTGNRKQKKGFGIWDMGSGKRNLKSETRISKSETNQNHQNSNGRNKKAINSKNGEYLNDSERSERMTSSGELNDKSGKFSNDSEQSEQMTVSGTSLHSTFDIIKALEKNLLPDQIMINTHPQRWTDILIPWIKELVWQNTKNLIKMRIKS